MQYVRNHLPECILWALIIVYAIYFSTVSIYRMHSFNAHYYDLGIMHQTTYNTYKALTTGEFSRFLEMTNTLGPEQIKRMAIHNDIILAFIAPLYVLYSGPETLLVVQSIALALGAYGLFLLTKTIFKKDNARDWVGLVVAIAYLIYPMVNYTNMFEFHGVALATPFLIFMFYFWYIGRNKLSMLFAVLSMLTKEQVALTVLFFALFAAGSIVLDHYKKKKSLQEYFRFLKFPIILAVISIVWFVLSLKVIIPMSRGGTEHFALKYYGEFGESPGDVVFSVIKNPLKLFSYLLSEPSTKYLQELFLPLSFLSLLSPIVLGIAAPEFGVNLLSEREHMRNIIYHYTAVLTPFIFISAIYSMKLLIDALSERFKRKNGILAVCLLLIFSSLYGALTYGPLPFSKREQTYMFRSNPPYKEAVYSWSKQLKDDSIKVASSGKFAPFFTSRRYFYDMSIYYTYADYVVINPKEVYESFGSERATPGYEALKQDKNYQKIVSDEFFEVYKRKQPAK